MDPPNPYLAIDSVGEPFIQLFGIESSDRDSGRRPSSWLRRRRACAVIVYTIVANFGVLRKKSSNHSSSCFIAFSERSRPSKHDAENRMPKFETVRIWGLVKNSDFCLQDCFFFFFFLFLLLLPILPTFTYSNFSPLLLVLGQWNFVCSFLTSFSSTYFFIFPDFDLVHPKTWFFAKNLKSLNFQLFPGTISPRPMKFRLQLPYIIP